MKRLLRLLRLPAAERWLLAKAALLLVAIRVGLWALPFQTLRRFLATVARIPVGLREADRSSVEWVVWAVEVTGRHLPVANTCLTQALATQVLLARRGQSPLVRIGVAKGEGGKFEAHAWVECGGEVIIGGHELERYTSLVALEGRSS
jgi:Transglutaminase-like superfamily